MFYRTLFPLFPLGHCIELSVLQFTYSAYQFGIFKPFLFFLPKYSLFSSSGQRPCELLPSLGVRRRRRPSVIQNQIKVNLAGMVLGWVLFKIVSDRPALQSRWLLLLKIEISSIVHCCFIINLNELKFLLQLHGNE